MEKEWRFLKDGLRDGASNMAIDEAILWAGLKGIVSPTIRLYGWSPAAVSLGYAQDPKKDINLDSCRGLGLDIVRRPTGGRAVLHEQELTYSLVAPEDIFPKPGSVLGVYKEISQALIVGLSLLGIEAQLVPAARKKGSVSAFCFSNPSTYEVAVGGKKIIGSAQRRCRGYVLQQGSIIIQIDRQKLSRIFSFSSPELWQAMISINEIKSEEIDFHTLQEVIQEGFSIAWGIRLRQEELTAYEIAAAHQLRQQKYQLAQWNLARPDLKSDLKPVGYPL
jgi:lipoate-protein ligase A